MTVTGEEALKAACIDAERIFREQYFAKIDSEPAAVIPLPFRETVLDFIRELEAGESRQPEHPPKRRKALRALLIAAIIRMFMNRNMKKLLQAANTLLKLKNGLI